MRQFLADCRIFFREFRSNFHTTGAVLPSGRLLSAALARFVKHGAPPRRILEVGPGTGAVTRRIIARMKPGDHLDLVELNDAFVARLRHLFASDAQFLPVADRSRVIHRPVEDLLGSEPYDLIISGLPLNNFAVADVERILEVLGELSRPGAVVSFFEYIAIRKLKAAVSGQHDRERLRGIGHAIQRFMHGREIRRDWIIPNVPPAWVHHVRVGAN